MQDILAIMIDWLSSTNDYIICITQLNQEYRSTLHLSSSCIRGQGAMFDIHVYITYNNYPYQLYFDTGMFCILQIYFVLYRYILYYTGILHGYKVPAVMSTYHVPSTYNIDIRDCADGGLDFTSPRSDVFVLNSQIQNNYGTGVNILGMSSNIYNNHTNKNNNNNNNIRSILFWINSPRGPITRSVQKSSVTSAPFQLARSYI